jgi:hypothetical protein
MIDRLWGTHLRHWLELPNTFRLLDRLSSDDAEFTSWHAGGCRVLACAVKASLTRLRYPGDLSLKVLASNESPADHVILRVKAPSGAIWYIDADGTTKERTLITRFAKREGRTGVRIIDYDETVLDHYGIECPPYKLFQVTKALSQVNDGW